MHAPARAFQTLSADRHIEVFRDPKPDPAQSFGYGCATHIIVTAEGTLTLLLPNVTLAVSDPLASIQPKAE